MSVAVNYGTDQEVFQLTDRLTFEGLARMVAARWGLDAASVVLEDGDACSWPRSETCEQWCAQLPDGVVYARVRRRSGRRGKRGGGVTSDGKVDASSGGSANLPPVRGGVSHPEVRLNRAHMLRHKQRKLDKVRARVEKSKFTKQGDSYRKRVVGKTVRRSGRRVRGRGAARDASVASLASSPLAMSSPDLGFDSRIASSLPRSVSLREANGLGTTWDSLEADLKDLTGELDPNDAVRGAAMRAVNGSDRTAVDRSASSTELRSRSERRKPKKRKKTRSKVRREKKSGGTPGLLSTIAFGAVVQGGGGLSRAEQEQGGVPGEEFDLKGALWRIFTFYCLQSKKANALEHMSNNQFVRLLQDARVVVGRKSRSTTSRTRLTRQEIDVIYMLHSSAKTSLGHLTFELFLKALRVVAEKWIRKQNTAESYGEGDEIDAFSELVYTKVIPNASTWSPDPRIKELSKPSVQAVFDTFRDFFIKVVQVFSARNLNGALDFKTFLDICQSYSIQILKVTTRDLGVIFLMSKSGDRRNYLNKRRRTRLAIHEFITCLGLIAMQAFERRKLSLERRVKALMMHMALNNKIEKQTKDYSRRNLCEVAGFLHAKFLEMWIKEGRENYLAPEKKKKEANKQGRKSKTAVIAIGSPMSPASPVSADALPAGAAGSDRVIRIPTVSTFSIQDLNAMNGSAQPRDVFDELDQVVDNALPVERKSAAAAASGAQAQEGGPEGVDPAPDADTAATEVDGEGTGNQIGGDGKATAARASAGPDEVSAAHQPAVSMDGVLDSVLSKIERTIAQNGSRADVQSDGQEGQDGKDQKDESDSPEPDNGDDVSDQAAEPAAAEESFEPDEEQKLRKRRASVAAAQAAIDRTKRLERENAELKERLRVKMAEEAARRAEEENQRKQEEEARLRAEEERREREEEEARRRAEEEEARRRAEEERRKSEEEEARRREEEERQKRDEEAQRLLEQARREEAEAARQEAEREEQMRQKRAEEEAARRREAEGKNKSLLKESETKTKRDSMTAGGVRDQRELTRTTFGADGSDSKSTSPRAKLIENLCKGNAFIKYGRWGGPKDRILWLTENAHSLAWGKTRKKSSQTVDLGDIQKIVLGQKTPLFQKKALKKHKVGAIVKRSFSLILMGKKRSSVDLIAATDQIFEQWVGFLRSHVTASQSMQNSIQAMESVMNIDQSNFALHPNS